VPPELRCHHSFPTLTWAQIKCPIMRKLVWGVKRPCGLCGLYRLPCRKHVLFSLSSGRIRPSVLRKWAGNPDFVIKDAQLHFRTYVEYLKKTKFCLVLRGREVCCTVTVFAVHEAVNRQVVVASCGLCDMFQVLVLNSSAISQQLFRSFLIFVYLFTAC